MKLVKNREFYVFLFTMNELNLARVSSIISYTHGGDELWCPRLLLNLHRKNSPSV